MFIQFHTNKEEDKAIEFFKNQGGSRHASTIARTAIMYMFRREAPAAYQKPEKLDEREEGKKICELLGGHDSKEYPGNCAFKVYEVAGYDNMVNERDFTLPYSHLSKETIETQYRPSKEKYFEIKAKLEAEEKARKEKVTAQISL